MGKGTDAVEALVELGERGARHGADLALDLGGAALDEHFVGGRRKRSGSRRARLSATVRPHAHLLRAALGCLLLREPRALEGPADVGFPCRRVPRADSGTDRCSAAFPRRHRVRDAHGGIAGLAQRPVLLWCPSRSASCTASVSNLPARMSAKAASISQPSSAARPSPVVGLLTRPSGLSSSRNAHRRHCASLRATGCAPPSRADLGRGRGKGPRGQPGGQRYRPRTSVRPKAHYPG